MDGFSVYIHLPFCKTRCVYCDFYSTVADSIPFERYSRALSRELSLRRDASLSGPPVSIYIGGGTPSLWPAEYLERILGEFDLRGVEEVTVEVNPKDADSAWFDRLVAAGVHRFSVGVESMEESRLRFLGRRHTMADSAQAVRSALNSGARSVSADLIFGTPGHEPSAWALELSALLDLGVHHLSAYQLTVAEGTSLFVRGLEGACVTADEDTTARLYQTTRKVTSARGFPQYEVSNFAPFVHRSRHNSWYWQGGKYLGLGAGAHGFVRSEQCCVRYANAENVAAYLTAVEAADSFQVGGFGEGAFTETLSEEDHAKEQMMLGLRTVDGAPFEEILAILPETLQRRWRKEAVSLEQKKLARVKNGRLVPTAAGLIRADGLAERFF